MIYLEHCFYYWKVSQNGTGDFECFFINRNDLIGTQIGRDYTRFY